MAFILDYNWINKRHFPDFLKWRLLVGMLGGQGFVQQVRDLICNHNADILFFWKQKLTWEKLKRLMIRIGFPCSFIAPNDGLSVGLLLIRKNHEF